ncbi:hypothetical protein [Methanoculleus sp. 7T]|jgi:hypothetical protein|uniref:hypothetical protein n=1 Tax=Methanoculleus sp. 7T TaxID=2937282 RepID=UPI0020BF1A00|nr:hypothetical protein [Methanoculleus sp. 7T]MCK8518614.1 hypothetical protein [Methanoculleus sp. 7T]
MAYDSGRLSCPIQETLAAIQEGLTREYRAAYLPAHRRSPRRTRRLRRIRGWGRETGRLVSEIDRVMQQTLPRIERDTRHTFRDPDGILRILMDPSTKRLFFGILAGFPEHALPAPAKDLDLLGKFSDDARALALIGDVTLRLRVLPGPDAEVAGLAPLCDRWSLHESKLGLECRRRPTGDDLQQEKETLAGAVLGLIYVEGGVDALRAAVPLL